MTIQAVGTSIASQVLNDNFSYLEAQRIALSADVAQRAINVKYPPSPLVAAVGDGVANDTAAIQAAANALSSGGILYFPAGTYKITTSISLLSNVISQGCGSGTIIKLATGDISGFLISSKSGVTIKDLKISAEVAGTTAYKGGIELQSSSNCLVEDVLFVGMSWAGIYCNISSNNIFRGNRFDSFLGSLDDTGDIIIYRDSNYNIVEDNFCYGGSNSWFGVNIQDPSGTTSPIGNKVLNNQISEHKAYGVNVYYNQQVNSKTIVKGNNIRDILGSAVSGASGAGIYIQSAGGCVVSENEISNCCRLTTNFGTLAPAGIGVTNILSSNTGKVVLSNNTITGMTKAPAIFVNTSGAGILLEGNIIDINNTGAGTSGHGIYIKNSTRTSVKGGTIKQGNVNYWAVNLESTIVGGLDGAIVEGLNIYSLGLGIGFNPSGGGTFVRSIISNTYIESTLKSLFLNAATDTHISGSIFQSVDYPIHLASCPRTRMSNNRFNSTTGALGPIFTGVNTGSFMDAACTYATVMENSGTGVIVEQYANAAPVTGYWAVGDRIIQSVPVVGSPKGWRCTVAGNPGTWVSEGNL